MDETFSVKRFHRSREFKNVVVFSKLLFVFLLSILALINHDNEYIKKNPRYFVEDSLMLGTSSALATAFLDFVRIGSVNHRHVLDMFFLFFTYHVLRELSGYFKFVSFEESEMTEVEKKEKMPLFYTVLCVFGVLAIIGSILAFKVMKHPSRANSIDLSWSSFVMETIIFAIITSVPEIFIGYRHESVHTWKTLLYNSILTFGIFTVFHFMFQIGGFYSVVLTND